MGNTGDQLRIMTKSSRERTELEKKPNYRRQYCKRICNVKKVLIYASK